MQQSHYQTLLGSHWRHWYLLPFCIIGSLFLFTNRSCSAAVNPTVSLSVTNPNLSTTVAPGETAYLSSNVTYSASDIESYTIQVSYADGFDSLKLDGGTATLTGTGGKTPTNMNDNTWGFAWTNDTTNTPAVNSGLTYYTVPAYGTNGTNISTGKVENVTLPTTANNTLASTTRRIVFAAKFAANNDNTGHYKTKVQLSMVATPRKLTLGDISNMQDVTPEICENTLFMAGKNYSDVYTLTDNRTYPSGASKTYTVRKFADGGGENSGRCWMTENLRIYDATLKPEDSDIKAGTFNLTSTTNKKLFDNSDAGRYTTLVYRATTSDPTVRAGLTTYYNWFAATAGAGTEEFIADNTSVDTSICPKGWTLPTGGSNSSTSDFGKFASAAGIGNDATGYATISNDIYNFLLTGRISSGYLYTGTGGHWWSSTVKDIYDAYYLDVDTNIVNPGRTSNNRYFGYAVRCIARSS